jgi:hypothetical protein
MQCATDAGATPRHHEGIKIRLVKKMGGEMPCWGSE